MVRPQVFRLNVNTRFHVKSILIGRSQDLVPQRSSVGDVISLGKPMAGNVTVVILSYRPVDVHIASA